MNIIIPIGGKGERFINSGYTDPKPLIKIFEKCMIEYVLDNLIINNNDKIFIIYNYNLDKYNFKNYINNKYQNINFIQVNDTSGASETLFYGIDYILKNYTYNKRCLILDCDTFYTIDIINIFSSCNTNIVFYTKNYNTEPIYSYIELNNQTEIINIKEKIKISDNANTGAYAFLDINILYDYCKFVLDNNITFNNEPYISCIIAEMLKTNINFKGYELNSNNVFSLGTPKDVDYYINNTYLFLFDLDGTLVITDEIYFNVWSEILIQYNIILNNEIYKNYIQGNNDNYVLNTLLYNTINLNDLSQLKDTLFIKNINKIKIIDGIYDIINQIKVFGYKLCIVTNCNKQVALEIIKYIKIDTFIDFIISSNDCKYGKPHKEPYEKAINKYNIKNNNYLIFEDSKSGILSGKSINPKLLVGIETIYDNNELLNYGAHLSIKDYSKLNIIELLNNDLINNKIKLINMIKNNSIIFNIENVFIDDTKLKGGFIADVISFKIITNNNEYNLILKYENILITNLSIMANKLKLYEREYYFYVNISKNINVCIPTFYNLIIDDDNNNKGIVLENLLYKNYKINLNLNDHVDIALKIVDRMSQMHYKFWNTNLKKKFPDLKMSNDTIFNPFFSEFIKEKYELFKNIWFKLFNQKKQDICNYIYDNFSIIQNRFSIGNNLTLIHGDIKSPNIFYDLKNNFEPYFIDWQHCAIGKGVQDLIFFIIESFDIVNIKIIYPILKNYYYKKIIEYKINYTIEEYENDIYDAICYIPFFTSIWFGTLNHDELIDKNFPYFFINKMFYLLEIINNK